nr:MAG TPA: hypothetical protein [Caudoviricetes sp.]
MIKYSNLSCGVNFILHYPPLYSNKIAMDDDYYRSQIGIYVNAQLYLQAQEIASCNIHILLLSTKVLYHHRNIQHDCCSNQHILHHLGWKYNSHHNPPFYKNHGCTENKHLNTN